MNAPNDNEKFDFNKFHHDLWRDRLDVPEHLFTPLVDEHMKALTDAITPMMEESTDALLEDLSGLLINAQSDWYREPAKKAVGTLDKLSRGFALAAPVIAGMFKDSYVGADIQEVLLNPDRVPASYPNSIGHSALYFMKAAASYLPEEFWQQSEDLKRYGNSFTFLGDFAYSDRAATLSELHYLHDAQTLMRAMPLLATALREAGHANLSTIAACFARKGQVMSDDLIRRAEQRFAVPAQASPMPAPE